MILIAALMFFGALLLAGAWHQFRLKPTMTNRVRALIALVLGTAVILVTAYAAPSARLREAALAGQADQARLNAELVRVRALSEALGGPMGYIEYLKATKDD